jgi:hypothetical protein
MLSDSDRAALKLLFVAITAVIVLAVSLPKNEQMPRATDWHTTAKVPHPMDVPFVGYWVDDGKIATPLVLCLTSKPGTYFYYDGNPKYAEIAFIEPPIQWVCAPGYDGD